MQEMPMLRCQCCGEMSLPKAESCSRCGSSRLELEPAAQQQKTERAIFSCLGIAACGALSTVIGHSMLHDPGAHHTWACVLLIGGIGMVTAAAMIIAVFAMREDGSVER